MLVVAAADTRVWLGSARAQDTASKIQIVRARGPECFDPELCFIGLSLSCARHDAGT
jgi:hypothetical protein